MIGFGRYRFTESYRSIEVGTLAGLVDHMMLHPQGMLVSVLFLLAPRISPGNSTMAGRTYIEAHQDILLAMYPLFTSGSELFTTLRGRFVAEKPLPAIPDLQHE